MLIVDDRFIQRPLERTHESICSHLALLNDGLALFPPPPEELPQTTLCGLLRVLVEELSLLACLGESQILIWRRLSLMVDGGGIGAVTL